jgi:hypothetical protein
MKAALVMCSLMACAPLARAQVAETRIGDAARVQLDAALRIVRGHSLWRDTVSWATVEADIRAMAAGAETAADVYPALRGGGNMWPMLRGLRPILGEGDLGTFVVGDQLHRPPAHTLFWPPDRWSVDGEPRLHSA